MGKWRNLWSKQVCTGLMTWIAQIDTSSTYTSRNMPASAKHLTFVFPGNSARNWSQCNITERPPAEQPDRRTYIQIIYTDDSITILYITFSSRIFLLCCLEWSWIEIKLMDWWTYGSYTTLGIETGVCTTHRFHFVPG
jgi:hypothetical protein